MTVEIIHLQFGHGGAIKGAYFADSFIRTDVPWFIGSKWGFSFMPQDTQTFSNVAAASLNVAANNLVIANSGGGGSVPKGFGIPIAMNSAVFPWDNGATLALPQFSEIKITGNAAVVNSGFGVGVLMDVNGGNCYSMRNSFTGSPVYRLERFVNGINSTLIADAPCNIGDVMRLEVIPGAIANALTMYINSVVVNTFNDNDPTRSTFGIPGLVTNGTGAGGSFSYQLFKCGTLPQISTANDFP
jgi:hypothetical protein